MASPGVVRNIDADAVAAHKFLVRRQLQGLKKRMGENLGGSEARLAGHSERASRTWRAILASAGVTARDLDNHEALSQADSAYAFLRLLPHAVAVGSAAGDALESGLFGSCSEDVREISSLVQLSSLVLDGLIDEAPGVFDPERETLFSLLRRESWASDHDMGTLERLGDKHPAVELLYKVTLGWVGRVRQAKGWLTELSLRKELPFAVENAILAEYESDHRRFDLGDCTPNIESCRRIVRAKGANAMWVTALIPICVHGWPQSVERDNYRRSAYLTGTYVGWIDDIHDVLIDLEAGRWSSVLLDLYVYAGQPEHLAPAALKETLIGALADKDIRERLVRSGLEQYDELVSSLLTTGSDSGPILQLIQDATLAGVEE